MKTEASSIRPIYRGLLLTTLSTLMYQLVLTRIFSVTMFYHFSFMAVSITMFGMTVGAIIVYLAKSCFPNHLAQKRMGQFSLLFAALIVGTFFTHLSIPFVMKMKLIPLWSVAVNYFILSLPFVASGITVSIALTQFPERIGKLYAVDLIGAGLGCLATVVGLNYIDAPTLVLIIALVAALGGISYLDKNSSKVQRYMGYSLTFAIFLLTLFCVYSSYKGSPQINLTWVKGKEEVRPLYEKWNAFSRIAVWDNDGFPDGWGISSRYLNTKPTKQKLLNIDAGASTSLTHFEKDPSELDFLKYDITNAVHYLRNNARVMVVGVGGGRDILSSLHFKQRETWGVEINQAIFHTLITRFGDYTHHLAQMPGVKLINDEARSFLTRTKEKFDIIQVSLIDTWAASAAGAFVLTENSLYTQEAWARMLNRLTPTGILTFSRWYSPERPWEIYRLTALASRALRNHGISDPRSHLLILTRPRMGMGVATLMISPTPFSSSDIQNSQHLANQMDFTQLISPKESNDPILSQIVASKDLKEISDHIALDITPPTDNKPFFFNMLRIKDLFNFELMNRKAIDQNLLAVTVLAVLLLTVIVLCLLAIIIPLLISKNRISAGTTSYFIYFSAIGLGYMFIEIGLIQRLNIFLGHPIYSMTVVLFSLLVATGIGSFFSSNLWNRRNSLLVSLCFVLTLNGLVQPYILEHFASASTALRILVAILLLFPMGTLMGMGFPIGMQWVSRSKLDIGPWLFGINGSMSIVGSVAAMGLSLFFNIDTTFFMGTLCYLIASGTILLKSGSPSPNFSMLGSPNENSCAL